MSDLPTSEALMAQATEATGLSDFGDPTFRTGLDRLLESVGRESQLSERGKVGFPAAIVKRLVNRLEIEDWYRRHPEIEDEVIRDPVFIVGLPRTGSTALGHMLSLDPETRSLRAWEAVKPCPPAKLEDALTDPRIAENKAREEAFDAIAPGVREALPRNNPNAPSECFTLLEMAFGSAAEVGFLHCPTFQDWVTEEGQEQVHAAYRYHRRVLKLMQWRHPAPRWQLRTPIHALGIEALHAVYPEARFIMSHRDPAKVVPSNCSLVGEVRKLFLEDRHIATMGPDWTNKLSLGIDRLMRFRDRIGEDRFFDVAHKDQIADPIGTVRSVYEALGWAFDDTTADRITAWRAAHPKGNHKPEGADYGIDPAQVDRQFADYRRRFAAYI